MSNQDNIFGIKYEVDIESLKTSTREAQKQVNLANAEFEKTASSLDKWSESSEGLSAKLNQLGSVLSAQTTKLNHQKNDYNTLSKSIQDQGKEIDSLKNKREQAIATYGKESQEVKQIDSELKKLERTQKTNTDSLQTMNVAILKQEAQINKTNKAIGNFEEQLKDVSEAEKKATSSGRSLTEELKDIKSAGDQAEQSMGELEGGFTVLKGTIANLVANGITALVSGIASAVEQSREFRTEMAKLKVMSDKVGNSFEETKDAYKELLSTSNDEGASTEALNNILSAGFKGDAMDEVIKGIQGIALQFKDTLKQEGIADSIQEWIGSAGESLTGNFAEWLERMGYNLEEVTEQTKGFTDAQRQKWIVDQMNKQGVMDITDAYKEQNKGLIDSSNAQFEYNESLAKVGEKIEPIATAFKTGFTEIMNAFLEMTEGVDFQAIADGISSVFQWIIDNKEIIIASLAGILAGLLAMNVGHIISGLATAFGVLNTIMSANPIMAIVGLIAMLVTGFITLWNTSDDFRNFWSNLWDNIVNFVSGAISGIVDFFVQLPGQIATFIATVLSNITTWGANLIAKAIEIGSNFLSNIVSFFTQLPGKILSFITTALLNVGTWVSNMIAKAVEVGTDFLSNIVSFFTQLPGKILEFLNTALNNVGTWAINMGDKAIEVGGNFLNGVINFIKQLPGKILTHLTTILTNLGAFAGDMLTKGIEAGQKLFNGIVDEVVKLPGRMLEIGADIVSGIWDGITSMGDWLWGKISGWADSIVGGIKDFFGIASPSKETRYDGQMLVEGLIDGMLKTTPKLMSKAKGIATQTMNVLKKGLNKKLSINPEIVSNIKSSARNLLNNLTGQSLELAGATGASERIIFNQYNTNSPQSRWDIMRQTRNLLLQAKKGG